MRLGEISTAKLDQYTKAADADYEKATAAGDYKKSFKRASGMMKASGKKIDNDVKAMQKARGVAEDYRDNPMYGQDADFDNMLLRREAKRKGMTVAQYKNYLEKQKQDQEHELNIGSAGRAELKQKADELAEIKREKLRNERLHDEQVAFQRAETVQQRKDEMQKIADKYKQDLTVIDKEHRNNMESIRTGNNHEINKIDKDHAEASRVRDWESSERDKDRPKPEKPKPVEMPEPEEEPRPRPSKPTYQQYDAPAQAGLSNTKPPKPSKYDNDDVTDVEPVKPKPNKPFSLKEKITVVKDPAKATSIQQTGGITQGSVYTGKPLPQSLQQKLDGKTNTARAVDAKGRTQQQWMKLVKAKFPDAKIMQSKMIDGPVFAMLSDGRKLSWNKVEQGAAEATEYGIPDSTPGQLPGGAKMTFGEFKKMWPGVILKRPSGGSLAGSVVADVEGWMNNPKSVWEPLEGVAEVAPGALRAVGGLATAALTGIGGALIGQMFAPFVGATAGGIAGAIGGYKAGAGATDALWDKVVDLFGSKENAEQAAMVHAQAAAAGEKSFEFGGKKYPVTLKPQDAQKLNLEGVAEGSLDDIEDTRQFRNAIALAKSQKTIRHAKHGKDTKFYADGTPVTPEETARRAAERKARKQGVAEGMFGIDSKTKGAIQNVVAKLSDIPNMWDHSAQTFTNLGKAELEKVLNFNPKYIDYALNLTYKDFEADMNEGKFDPINDDDFYEYNIDTKEIVSRVSGKHPEARKFTPMQKEWAGRDDKHKFVRGINAKYLNK